MTELNTEFAAQLKEEGNKFFANKQYSQAYDKYSKALKAGGDNAILYSNRSACCYAMGRYLDACSDARKATELDPAYVKGWGRLAAAEQELGSWERAAEAYKTAIAKLPSNNLSAAEEKQKKQYEASLSLAEEKMKSVESDVHKVNMGDIKGRRPFDRATAIFESAQRRGKLEECIFSSVNTIYMAGNDFEEGMQKMRQLQKIQLPDGRTAFQGRLDVLEDISNAIFSDRRSFYIDDPKWLDKYNEQMILQIQMTGAWESAGPEVVLAEAQKRVAEHGWEATRLALSTTVRSWIMRAFLVAGLMQDHKSAEQFYRNVIDVLERGRKIWAHVPKDDRGSIFEDTFIYGVRALHLESFMRAHATTGGTDARFNVDYLEKSATDLLHDVEGARKEKATFVRTHHGEGFYLSYYVYPAAEASGIKAYCLKHKAKGKPSEECAQLFGESAEYYALAAKMLPEDDEYHCQYLMNSLGSWWLFDDVPLKTTLPLLAQLKKNVPKMKQIWAKSALAMDGRDELIDNCLKYYEDVQKKMEAGALTENDSYNPPFQI